MSSYNTLLQDFDNEHISYTEIPHSAEILLQCPVCVGRGKHQEYGRLYVNIHKQTGYCQRCQWAGNKKKLYDILHITPAQKKYFVISFEQTTSPSPIIASLPPNCIHAWQHNISRAYLSSRNITKNQVELFGLQYCVDHPVHGKRIIIPIFNHHTQYMTFTARTITNAEPKYRKPKGSKTSHILYNLNFFYQKRKAIWLVEGVFDAMHCWPYAVATFGKTISETQIQLLRMAGFQHVYVVWDADAHQLTPDSYNDAINRLSQHFFTYPVKLPAYTPTEYSLLELKKLCKNTQPF